ncbi:MAG: taurine catabolism dioxygenase TauD [Kangiella sp.]|nr:MAG: taurine catabolism dioxygenase TauD [Kangiella sp.]
MMRPKHISEESSWLGVEIFQQADKWIWQLSDVEVNALETACNQFLDKTSALENISSSTFICPSLNNKLLKIRNQLTNGIGFTVIRGLDVSRYSRLQIATIFMGIGSHIGSPRSQNAAGHLLGHVRNIGSDANDTNTRIYQTNERQTFHTDSCDVVGLICLKTAKQGGESLLVSAESIYNEMMKQNANLTNLLFKPIATDKRGEVEVGEKPYFSIPVFSWFNDRLSVIYQRQYIDSAQRFDDVKNHSTDLVKALDLFDSLANDPSLNFSMQLQTGDIQFVHNHSLLHDRRGFEDWSEEKEKRHLLRLWLTVPDDRELPPNFSQRFGTTKVGDRGGVIVEGTKLTVTID